MPQTARDIQCCDLGATTCEAVPQAFRDQANAVPAISVAVYLDALVFRDFGRNVRDLESVQETDVGSLKCRRKVASPACVKSLTCSLS